MGNGKREDLTQLSEYARLTEISVREFFPISIEYGVLDKENCMSTKVSKLCPTPDDWHPTLEGGFVCVVLYTDLPFKYKKGLIVVRGGDDDALERWFTESKDANNCYSRLIRLAFIDKAALIGWGFSFV